VYVGQNVAADQRVSMDDIDHRLWDQLLHKYVDQRGGVAYQPWVAHAGHLRALDAYLGMLSTADPQKPASRSAKLAYWINAYNAVTVRGILREFPTDSIRNHTSKFGGYNIWKDLQLIVGGSSISLESIEHQVLRGMGEPRIHFAIVCASHSCPRLLNEAYVPDRLDSQLTTNSRDFFRNPENFRYDPSNGRFQLSAIIDWFGEDFGANNSARLQTLAPFLPTPDSQQAATRGEGRISYLKYDWSLNDRSTIPTPSAGTNGSGTNGSGTAGSGTAGSGTAGSGPGGSANRQPPIQGR
jgi:hypothetical protein